jgi:hypothetical protein
MMPYDGGVITAFADGPIFFSPDGSNPRGGGSTIQVYSGTQTVVAMIPYGGGVFTSFRSGRIYFSPNGLDLGGGPSATVAYGGLLATVSLIPFNGGVLTAFQNYPARCHAFFSPWGQNIGGGGFTAQVCP